VIKACEAAQAKVRPDITKVAVTMAFLVGYCETTLKAQRTHVRLENQLIKLLRVSGGRLDTLDSLYA
jgi:hypothetical protein